jgi:hypothetical protein
MYHFILYFKNQLGYLGAHGEKPRCALVVPLAAHYSGAPAVPLAAHYSGAPAVPLAAHYSGAPAVSVGQILTPS